MRAPAVTLAHLVVLALAIAGCSESHGRDPRLDAGTGMPPSDAGVARDGLVAVLDGFVAALDAGPRAGLCVADDARAALCPELLCDGPPRWYWSGDDCFWIDCGACEGADCARGFGSEGECMAAHASCDAALCRTSGGTWMWWTEECTHFHCGRPGPIDCVIGRPVCDCGPFRTFDEARGCVEAECPIPEPIPREDLCIATGGEWGPFCCDSVCGERCADACAAMACDCPGTRTFEDARGCVEATRCHERLRGEDCEGETRCEEGTICCQHCGGPGCFGSTCEPPTCDTDERTDICGNRVDVP